MISKTKRGGIRMKYKPIVFLAVLTMLLSAANTFAEETDFFPSCYTADEIQEVRAWEKTWTGKKITSAEVDQVKEFLPSSLYDLMKNTDRWGESSFIVGSYQQVKPTPGRAAMTKKYYGQTKVGPNRELLNYTSGVPFPFSKDGTEMAHNARNRTYGDGYIGVDMGYIVDGRLKYDMTSEVHQDIAFFSGRQDIAPVPELAKNPKNIWRAFQMMYKQPPESRNLRIMDINYKDRLKASDSWMWFPTIRRIRRRATTEKQDANGGADFAGYDNWGWDGPVQFNKYKYTGQKDLLMVRHSDNSKLVRTPGDCLVDGSTRERVKMHVVEVTNIDEYFMYSKMTWYIDPETWAIIYLENYDRHGKLWKIFDWQHWVDPKTGFFDITAGLAVDVQRIHSTIALAEHHNGPELKPRTYTLQWMQKNSY